MKLLKVSPSPLLQLLCMCGLCTTFGTHCACIKINEAFFFKGHGLLGIHTFDSMSCAARVEPPFMEGTVA